MHSTIHKTIVAISMFCDWLTAPENTKQADSGTYYTLSCCAPYLEVWCQRMTLSGQTNYEKDGDIV